MLGESSNGHTRRLSRLEAALFEFFRGEIQRGNAVSDGELQKKARDLNKRFAGDPQFCASNSWISRWKKRHNVKDSCDEGNKMTYNIIDYCSDVNPDKIIKMFPDEMFDSQNDDQKILFIEPFYGGSHKQLIDTLLGGNSVIK